MSRMSDSMRNMASSWMLKNREPEFQEMSEYTKNFREKMLALETVSDKIAKDRFGKKVFSLTLEAIHDKSLKHVHAGRFLHKPCLMAQLPKVSCSSVESTQAGD